MKTLTLMLVTSLIGGKCLSQIIIDSTKKIITQPNVEVIAIRAAEKAPFTTTTLNSKNLANINQGQDLPMLLNQTPSVTVNSDAGNGIGYTGIKIRGTDATRINVTINGVPYNDAESQGVYFVDIPDIVSSVSSIQIQRGVGSSTNGSGAFGATISMSTYEKNERPKLCWSSSFGSFNTIKNTLKLSSGLIGKHLTVDGRISGISSNGYVDRASAKLTSGMVTIAYSKGNTNIALNVISGKETTYQAYYGVLEATLKYNRTYNIAGTQKPNEPYKNEVDKYNQNHLQLIWNEKISSSLRFAATTFYTKGKGNYEQYRADEAYSNYGLPNYNEGNIAYTKTDLIRQQWLNNNYYGQIITLIYTKKNSELTFGGLVSKYDGDHYGQIIWATRGIAKNYKWYNNIGTKNENSGFVKWQLKLDKNITAYSDLQYRNVRYSTNGFRNNPMLKIAENYHFVNPKVGLHYNNDANTSQYSISYANSNKEPNRDDYETTLNTLPKAENLHNVEINYANKINKKINYTATLYYMYYKNQLILTGKINDVGATTRINTPTSNRAGIELVANYTLTPKLLISGNVTLSSNKIKQFNEYIDNYDNGTQLEIEHNNTDITLSPSVIAAATVQYSITEKLVISLFEKYVGKQYLDNTKNEDRKIADYFTKDLLLTYTPALKKIEHCSFKLGIYNVLNKKYEPNGYTYSFISNNIRSTENYYYPMAGTNYLISMQIGIGK